MDPLHVDDFVRIVGGVPSTGLVGDTLVCDVAIHSHRVSAGSAFFALAGAHADGHDFVRQAVDNGAALAVVARSQSAAPALPHHAASGLPVVEVDDPLTALQRLAAWWRGQLRARVTAVAGSYGKTITKDALVDLLSLGGSVYGTHGSLNSRLGVPLAVLACPSTCDHAVIEVATSDPGDAALLREVVRPDNLLITSMAGRWQSSFARPDDEIDEMLAMAHALPADGWLLLCAADTPAVTRAAAAAGRPPHVLNASADLPTFTPTRWDPDRAAADMRLPDGRTGTVRIRTGSPQVVGDIQLAAAGAWLLGMPGPALLTALHDTAPSSARLEMWRSVGGITLVRNAASIDPVVTGQALRTARSLSGAARRTLLVLAEQLDGLATAAAQALAQVLVDEDIDELLGLDGPSHRLLATEVGALRGHQRIRLFEGVAALRAHLVADLRHGDVVLIQSPATHGIGDLATSLSDTMAPTRLYFDVTALEENVRSFRRIVGAGVRLMGVVKALAYGTDAVNVSLSLQECGIDFLAVSSADEGSLLRRAGILTPVLVLLGTAGEMEKMLRHRLTPLVYSPQVLKAVLEVAGSWPRPISVHVEVDTGMHRSGLEPEAARNALRTLRGQSNVVVEGLMTHLACADDAAEDAYTELQLRRFAEVSAHAEKLGLHGVIRHAAATASTIRLPASHLDMVRIGLGLYGLHPSPATRDAAPLIPVVGLVSRIVEILDVPEHERVGYGGTFTAPAGGVRVGVVPAGYHDGIPRGFSNVGHVVVHGMRCPMIGTLSMDSVTVDLSGCPQARVGSDVLIYGRHHDLLVSVEEIAATAGSIPHELLARLGPRVQRVFTRH